MTYRRVSPLSKPFGTRLDTRCTSTVRCTFISPTTWKTVLGDRTYSVVLLELSPFTFPPGLSLLFPPLNHLSLPPYHVLPPLRFCNLDRLLRPNSIGTKWTNFFILHQHRTQIPVTPPTYCIVLLHFFVRFNTLGYRIWPIHHSISRSSDEISFANDTFASRICMGLVLLVLDVASILLIAGRVVPRTEWTAIGNKRTTCP